MNGIIKQRAEGQILVARLPCGCVAGALFEDGEDIEEKVALDCLEWLRDGYVVKYEERPTVYAEKCVNHTGVAIS